MAPSVTNSSVGSEAGRAAKRARTDAVPGGGGHAHGEEEAYLLAWRKGIAAGDRAMQRLTRENSALRVRLEKLARASRASLTHTEAKEQERLITQRDLHKAHSMLVAKHEHSTQLEAQLAKARAEAEEWKGLSDELEGMTAETTALRNEVQGQKQATQGLQQTVGRLRGERERALLQSQQREQQHDLERAERLKMYRDSEMEILVREGALQREVDRLRGQAGAAETDFTQQTALRNEVQELDQANQGLKQTATRLRGERDCILLQFQQHNQKQVEILAREEALHREVASLKQARRQDAEARQQSVALRQALKQKVKHLEDAGCCAICLEAPPAAGFLHGDTVHRVCRGCAPKFHVGGPCPMCRVPVERVLQGVH